MIEGFNLQAQVSALASIEMEPTAHNQEVWSEAVVPRGVSDSPMYGLTWAGREIEASCVTGRCNAGWLLHHAGIQMEYKVNEYDDSVIHLIANSTSDHRRVEDAAAQVLGLDDSRDLPWSDEGDADLPLLFRQGNTLDDLYAMTAEYAGVSEEDVRLGVKREIEAREVNIPGGRR